MDRCGPGAPRALVKPFDQWSKLLTTGQTMRLTAGQTHTAQEKQADRAAEQDAVRARRAAEDHERAWRAKEKAEARRKQV